MYLWVVSSEVYDYIVNYLMIILGSMVQHRADFIIYNTQNL